MNRPAIGVAAEALRIAVHDLSQPAASAALAVDTALELSRIAGTEAIQRRLEGAASALENLRRLLVDLARLSAGSRSSGAHDLAAMMAAGLPGARLGDCPPALVEPGFFVAALRGLARDLGAEPAHCTAGKAKTTGRGEVCLRGGPLDADRITLWRSLLRMAGIDLAARRIGGSTVVRLTFPLLPAEMAASRRSPRRP